MITRPVRGAAAPGAKINIGFIGTGRIAREHDMPVTIRAFTREELMRADEVFLVGTAAEVTPVRELDGVEYATGKKTFGAHFQRAYLRAVTGNDENHKDWLTLV